MGCKNLHVEREEPCYSLALVICVRYTPSYSFRGVAQVVARVVWDHEAQSSNLCTPTTQIPYISRLSEIYKGLFIFLKTTENR